MKRTLLLAAIFLTPVAICGAQTACDSSPKATQVDNSAAPWDDVFVRYNTVFTNAPTDTCYRSHADGTQEEIPCP
jgi:hypothetical protein